jgi:hypothetical protein
MDLVIVIVLAVAIVGFLIGLVVFTISQQNASMAEALGRADAQMAKASQRLKAARQAELNRASLQSNKHPDVTTDMAGPETDRTNLKYRVPLPVAGAPVYFGGTKFSSQHAQGFSPEETLQAQKLAQHSFEPASSGEGRVQSWQEGLPARNRQGIGDELDTISTSAIITDPKLGDKVHH